MQSISNFIFNTSTIRVVTIDGNPWFVAADVCRVLGFAEHPKGGYAHHLHNLDATEKTNVTRSTHISDLWIGTRANRIAIISESGVYKLIMRSDKPQAKPFQDWVTKVVLPAIRKDGAYVMGEEKVATGEMSEEELLAKAFSILNKKVERLTNERDEALAVIDRELNHVTVDEYRALRHEYWSQGKRIAVGKEASRYCKMRGIPVKQQERIIHTNFGKKLVTVTEYPVAAVSHAAQFHADLE